MIIAHYEHRLPADYDIDLIRDRAKVRGPLWDDRQELYFKAFLLRDRGKFGATAHSFSSLYLWRHDQAFRDFLVGGGYKIVIDMFGRARIESWFALDARKGPGRDAQFAYRQDIQIDRDADLASTLSREMDRNADVARRTGTVASAIGIDVAAWTLTRVLLSEEEMTVDFGICYQMLYLARPLLDTLP
jgi:hypothetical protein